MPFNAHLKTLSSINWTDDIKLLAIYLLSETARDLITMSLSRLNSDYWNQLCGSRAAQKLGITAGDPNAVAIFDNWFFDFYPYLASEKFVPWSSLRSSRVLEVGLGYGSLTRRLDTVAKHIVSCDISNAPVVFSQMTTQHVVGTQASACDLPFRSDSFDAVISLGCLHHTGDLRGSIRECLRVVRPGGTLIIMVYNRYSYKRLIVSPIATLQSFWHELRGDPWRKDGISVSRRVARFWDRDPCGLAPPHTEFASRRGLINDFASATSVRTTLVNVDNITDLLPIKLQRRSLDGFRRRLLNTILPRQLGLDIYCVVVK